MEIKVEFFCPVQLAQYTSQLVREGVTFFVVAEMRYLKGDECKWIVVLTGGY